MLVILRCITPARVHSTTAPVRFSHLLLSLASYMLLADSRIVRSRKKPPRMHGPAFLASSNIASSEPRNCGVYTQDVLIYILPTGARAGVISTETFLNGTLGAPYVAADGMWYALVPTSIICKNVLHQHYPVRAKLDKATTGIFLEATTSMASCAVDLGV